MRRQRPFLFLLGLGLLLSFSNGMSISSCHADQNDFLNTASRLGNGIFIQSFEVSRHFMKQDPLDSSFFVKRRENQDEESSKSYRYEEQSPLSWNLGVAYSNINTSPSVTDPALNNSLFTGVVGLEWSVSPEFEASALIDIDTIPQEDYRHGAAILKFSYELPLKKLSKSQTRKIASENNEDNEDEEEDTEYDSKDASQFYKKLREKKLKRLERIEKTVKESRSPASEILAKREEEEGRLLYPYFKFTYFLGFQTHMTLDKTFRSPSRNGLSATQQSLNQYQQGPEILFSPSKPWKFLAAFHYCYYSGSVTSFLSNMEVGQSSRIGIAAGGGWSPFLNQILTFPDYTLDAGVEWDFSEKEKLNFYFNRTVYQALTQDPTIAISPTYFRNIGEKWRVGLGASVILGAPNSTLFSGSADLTFKL
jgi:hypothetical protein